MSEETGLPQKPKGQQNDNDATVGAGIGGAILGGSLGGPTGAVIGGVIGILLGNSVSKPKTGGKNG